MRLSVLGIKGSESIKQVTNVIKGMTQEEAVAAAATTKLTRDQQAQALCNAGICKTMDEAKEAVNSYVQSTNATAANATAVASETTKSAATDASTTANTAQAASESAKQASVDGTTAANAAETLSEEAKNASGTEGVATNIAEAASEAAETAATDASAVANAAETITEQAKAAAGAESTVVNDAQAVSEGVAADATRDHAAANLEEAASEKAKQGVQKKGILVTSKLGTALKGALAKVKNSFIAHPILATLAATAAAIGIVIAASKKANPSTETLAKNLDESKQKIQESTQKITEMESELEKVQSRMAELKAMGSLSVVDKKELEQLEAYNAQLEKSKELEKAQRRIQNQESVDKFIDWFENDMYDVGKYYYSLNDNLEKPSDAVNTREHPIAAFGYRLGTTPLQTSEKHFIDAMFDSFDKQIEERANATTTEAKDKADMLILMTFNKLII